MSLQWAGTFSSWTSCAEPCPTWLWMFPEMGHLPTLWPTFFSALWSPSRVEGWSPLTSGILFNIYWREGKKVWQYFLSFCLINSHYNFFSQQIFIWRHLENSCRGKTFRSQYLWGGMHCVMCYSIHTHLWGIAHQRQKQIWVNSRLIHESNGLINLLIKKRQKKIK